MKRDTNARQEWIWGRFTHSVSKMGSAISKRIALAGNLAVFSLSTIFWLVAKGPRRETLTPAFYNIGVLSLPVVMLTGVFIGMVLAVQSYPQFKVIGMETRIGAAINLSLVKELGPVLAATMLAGRVGSAIAAELGTMRVTEQIDALSSMGVSLDKLYEQEPENGLGILVKGDNFYMETIMDLTRYFDDHDVDDVNMELEGMYVECQGDDVIVFFPNIEA